MKIASFVRLLSLLLVFSCTKSTDAPDPAPTPVQTEKAVTFQPGPSDANSVYVSYLSSDGSWANGNNNSNPNTYKELTTCAWTTSGTTISRSYLSFRLDSIPSNAQIVSARLSLYGIPSSNTIVQGNNGSNNVVIQRVLDSWNQATITWNNQPQCTTEDQVELAASSSVWNYDVLDINVTDLVKAMKKNTPSKTSGFCLRQKAETPDRAMMFASSKHTDASKRPKLVVIYKN